MQNVVRKYVKLVDWWSRYQTNQPTDQP